MATQGYGCMGLSAFYGSAKTVTPEKARDVIHHASASGVKLFNSATFYGALNEVGFGANLRLLKTSLEGLDRSSYQLMVKVGMDTRCPVEKTGTSFVMKGDPAYIREDVEFALEQLGTDYIDIIVLCRVPTDVSIEEAVLGMKALVDEGKARHIALSEANATVIRRAHAVTPLWGIEQEWSLWSRDIEDEIVPTCRELGLKIVAYSPLGRGFLTGTIAGRGDLQERDYRLTSPKFSSDNIDSNLALVNAVRALADRKGITVGQLALAWLHSRGADVIPIPGTSSLDHFDQNYAALTVELTPTELAEIETIFHPEAAKGERYAGNHLTFHKN